MVQLLTAQRLTLKRLCVTYGPDPHDRSRSIARVLVNRWSLEDSETFLDELPIHEPPGPGPYGNFHPWNRWLGEQLMYIQSKGMDISVGEMLELIDLANFGARHHGAFVYFLKEEQL